MGEHLQEGAKGNTSCRCPRCGYDQRGVIATWREHCPLTGRCAECGLEYRWCEVLHPEKYEPQWCVEFTLRARGVPLASAKTLLRSFWPWGFWSRLKMSQPIRPGRLVAYVAILFLAPVLLGYVFVQGGAALYARHQMKVMTATWQAQLPQMIADVEQWLRDADANRQRPGLTSEEWEALVQQQKSALAQWKPLVEHPPVIDRSWLFIASEAIVFPTAQYSSASIVSGDRPVGPYMPPSQIWPAVLGNGMYAGLFQNRFNFDPSQRFGLTLTWLVIGMVTLAVFPVSLVVLPISRRRAKVRWVHIGRVAVYGLFIPVSVLWICFALFVAACFSQTEAEAWQARMFHAAVYGPPALLFLWWSAAIGRYLRMRHAMGTALMLLVLSFLAVLAAGYLFVPRHTIGFIDATWPRGW